MNPFLTIAAMMVIVAVVVAVSRLMQYVGDREWAVETSVIEVTPPLGLRSDPRQFFVSLHGLLVPAMERLRGGQPHIGFEISAVRGRVTFLIWTPVQSRDLVEDLLRAAHPGVEIAPASDPLTFERTRRFVVAEFGLSRSSYAPITVPDGESLAPLISVLSRADDDERVHVQLLVRPKPNGWQSRARRAVERSRDGHGSGPLSSVTGAGLPAGLSRRDLGRVEEKASEVGFDCALRVVVDVSRQRGESGYLRSIAAALRPFAGVNGFAVLRTRNDSASLDAVRSRRFPPTRHFILTPTEIAPLWTLPGHPQPGVEVIVSPRLAVPRQVPANGIVIGRGLTRGGSRPVAISVEAKRHHMHVLGPTGSGKTTLLANMIRQDLRDGGGIGLVDPKGDLFAAVLASIPPERIDEVAIVAPDDASVIGLNPLEWSDPEERELVAENTYSIFHRVYERYWGPRTGDILGNSIRTLVRRPDSMICMIPLLLTDPGFRRSFTRDIDDPIGLGGFWRWYESLSEGQRNEAIGPVMNKLRDFLVRTRIRRLLCQPRSTIDLRRIIDSGGILLADLSAGSWGEESSNLIGSFLVAKLWQAARSRGNVPEDRRRDFSLYVDEFQQFLGIAGPFGDTLAQARSFRLSLVLANQHLGQLPRDLTQSLASNARTRIAFQCGPDDARHLAREFDPLDARALMNIRRHEAVARVFASGETSSPFTITTLPPVNELDLRTAQTARERATAAFARPVADVDRDLSTALRLTPNDEPVPRAGRRRLE